jgi:hypothetical protein
LHQTRLFLRCATLAIFRCYDLRLAYFAPYVHFDDRTCTDYKLIYHHSANNPQHDTDVAKPGLTAATTEATDLEAMDNLEITLAGVHFHYIG